MWKRPLKSTWRQTAGPAPVSERAPGQRSARRSSPLAPALNVRSQTYKWQWSLFPVRGEYKTSLPVIQLHERELKPGYRIFNNEIDLTGVP